MSVHKTDSSSKKQSNLVIKTRLWIKFCKLSFCLCYSLFLLIPFGLSPFKLIPNAYSQKNLAELMVESFVRGREEAGRNMRHYSELRLRSILQSNQHLHEIQMLEMELRERRRQSLTQAALEGFAGSQYLVGLMHLEDGGSANQVDAAKWFQLSAEQGFVDAQVALGHMYSSGSGVPEDLSESAKWLQLAADQDHPEAQFYLGMAYMSGGGVAPDSIFSFELIKKAAQRGFTPAQYYIGIAYLRGIGTTIQPEKGIEWVLKAPPETCEVFDTCNYSSIALGLAYARGQSMAENIDEALQWFARVDNQVDVLNIMMTLGGEWAKDAHSPIQRRNAYIWFYVAGAGMNTLKSDSRSYRHPFATWEHEEISEGSIKADSIYNKMSGRKNKRASKKEANDYLERWWSYRNAYLQEQ